jgi:capsular exopolysaccharide synthesis family protein
MYQVERITGDIPVLGELPRIGRRQSKIVMHDDRSVLAEALRIVRTNLDYLIRTRKPGETHKNNIVYITSSVSGEGKTFLSVNLSMILSATDKSVLLIGADVRNPKFKKFFQNKSIGVTDIRNSRVNAGLTEFLVDPKLQPEDIVNRVTLFNNPIDVIYSGRIPPNPSELLMSDRLGQLLEQSSQKYDYVIVDTSPMMLVSDTLLIGHFANHTIYVTRAESTETKMLQFPMKLRADGKIKGLAFVVNDVKTSNLGYGGKYGYGYGKKKKSWFGR